VPITATFGVPSIRCASSTGALDVVLVRVVDR